MFLNSLAIQFVAKTILKVFGWNPNISTYSRYRKGILIYPHTTKLDFVVGLLVLLTDISVFNRTYFLVKPQLFDTYFGSWFFTKCHCIPASKLEDRLTGSVKRVSDFIKSKDQCIILMSPEGSVSNKPWRSGFWYIARESDVPIIVGGIDYLEGTFKTVYSTTVGPEEEYTQNMEKYLQKRMTEINPLYPQCSVAHFSGEPGSPEKPENPKSSMSGVRPVSWLNSRSISDTIVIGVVLAMLTAPWFFPL